MGVSTATHGADGEPAWSASTTYAGSERCDRQILWPKWCVIKHSIIARHKKPFRSPYWLRSSARQTERKPPTQPNFLGERGDQTWGWWKAGVPTVYRANATVGSKWKTICEGTSRGSVATVGTQRRGRYRHRTRTRLIRLNQIVYEILKIGRTWSVRTLLNLSGNYPRYVRGKATASWPECVREFNIWGSGIAILQDLWFDQFISHLLTTALHSEGFESTWLAV